MIENLSTGFYVAAGAIAAAVFSALLTFISLIVSKEQTTSSFRQKWIDALRDDLAIFLTSVANISLHAQLVSTKRDSGATDGDILVAMSSDLSAAYSRYHRIILRLNPKEHERLMGLIINLERTMSNRGVMADATKVGDLSAQVDRESHIVLKNEWKRVKRGEPTFIVVKYLSIILLVIGVIIGVISMMNQESERLTDTDKRQMLFSHV